MAAWARERVELHGYGEVQLRALSDGWRGERWFPSQWANVLNLELEVDLAPQGFGPFDQVGLFARGEVRYDCVWTSACGLSRPFKLFGDRANRAPENLTDAVFPGLSGRLAFEPPSRIHGESGRLVSPLDIPPIDGLKRLGAPNFDPTFAPVLDVRVAVKKIEGSIAPELFPQGPWHPEDDVRPLGSLRANPSRTLPLPLRPAVPDASPDPTAPQGLFVPSLPLRGRIADFDSFDQHLSQSELAWNHGAGQDENELRELFLDLEASDGRLWLRAGRQVIVWGKTELFRSSDQFNPQDLALTSLPSLEESRLALWALRGVWSFYEVGPFQDVRLELAANYDEFEPVDLGRCGEPYTIWLLCAKTFGLFAHGLLGSGIAGEERPPDPWDSTRGLEGGARVEFRWGRFSFAVTDFYGFDDAPVVDFFHEYTRRVDPASGAPLDLLGNPLAPETALGLGSGNRQLFDVFCSASVGVAAAVLPDNPAIAERCLLDLPNSQDTVIPGAGFATPVFALSQVLGGTAGGEVIAELIITTATGMPADVTLAELVKDPADGASPLGPSGATSFLSDAQEALLGCGPLYQSDCDVEGIDLFHAEASVLLQAFPQFEPGAPVATRFVGGRLVVLPGARAPDDPDYRMEVDGTPPPGFRTEMGAVSFNFLQFLTALGAASPLDEDCDPASPVTCLFVRGVFDVSGVQRPERRAGGDGRLGRRDFLWHGGSEIVFRYEKRNVLGFAMDFAEDRTKSSWGFELTWVDDTPFAVTDAPRGFSRTDSYNLTVSVDRPTFVNFLNPGRSFFLNMQWFLRWIDDYRGDGAFRTHGPFTALGTFTVATGYVQDRLLPAVTFVHDLRSASGGAIGQVTYRFSSNFSTTAGVAIFYGGPEKSPIPLRQAAVRNNGGGFQQRVRFEGLSPVAERDEIFLVLRYTF